MKRYLLFDSGCSTCSKLAREIEQVADGWLAARSLHDPEMQQLLNQAKPDWEWRPTLLEVGKTGTKAATGVVLAGKMAAGLGLRRAWQIGRKISRLSTMPSVADVGRREFFLQSGAFLLSLAFWPSRRTSQGTDPKNTIPIVESAPVESTERTTLVERAINSPELRKIGTVYNPDIDIRLAAAQRNILADGRQELVVTFNTANGDFVRYLERSAGYVRTKGGYYRKDSERGYLLDLLVINGVRADLPEGGVRVMGVDCDDPVCGWEQRSACEPCGSYIRPCEGWCCVCYDWYGNPYIIGCVWEWCGDCGNFC